MVENTRAGRRCAQCGQEFYRPGLAKFCGDGCRRAKARDDHHTKTNSAAKHAPVSVVCIECGQLFTYSRYSRPRSLCSARCGRRRDIRLHPAAHAARKARQRAIRRGRLERDSAELIVPWMVYSDDRWICHLCGGKVDKHKAHPHPQAPTLDHVIPLARGGLHVRSNVRTAHFICNSVKRDDG